MLSDRASEIVVQNGRLYHLGVADGELATNLFQVGDPVRAYRVAERFESVWHEIKNREYVTLTGSYQGTPMSVLGTGIGTDNVEIALIEAYAVHALDLESGRHKQHPPSLNLIRIGTSGGAQPDIEPGTLGLSQYALGLDGTGLFYDHPAQDDCVQRIEQEAERLLEQAIAAESRFKGRIKPYASKASGAVYRALVEKARLAGVDYVSGITVATPGFYGPSGRFIEGIHNTIPNIKRVLARLSVNGRRVINFEMESSLLFHLSDLLRCRAGTICPIISKPDPGSSVVDYHPYIEQSIDLALAAMRDLIDTPELR